MLVRPALGTYKRRAQDEKKIMFETKTTDIGEHQEIDAWLNGMQEKGYGVRIASQIVIPATNFSPSRIQTTAVKWKLMNPQNTVPVSRTIGGPVAPLTIDEIPEDPSISYDAEERPQDHG